MNDKLLGVRGVHASVSQKYLLLVNGKRIAETLWNLTDVDYNITLANVKRIEVIRGPSSATYGRAALTAVINIITDDELNGILFDASVGNHGYTKLSFTYATKPSDELSIQSWGQIAHIGGEERHIGRRRTRPHRWNRPPAQLDIAIRWAPHNIERLKDFELSFAMFNVLGTTIKRGGTVRRP